jgi:hypothetical protein
VNATVAHGTDPVQLARELQDLLSSSCQSVFAAYGIAVRPAATHPLDSAFASQVHFTGSLSGRLTVTIGRTPLIESLPIENGSEDDFEDWSRELTNQVMGLLKNGLLDRGAKVRQNLPTSVPRPSCPPSSDQPLPAAGHFAVRAEFDLAVAQLEAILEEA